MQNKLYDKLVLGYLIILVFIMLVAGTILTYFGVDPIYYENFLFKYAMIGILFYLFYKMNTGKFLIKDFAIIILFIFLYISYTFALDKYIALFGFIGRREGLLAIVSYYIYFLVASTLENRKYVKYFVGALSIQVILQIIYGFLQVLPIDVVFDIPIKFNLDYAFGLVGNSNFFASLQVMILGIWFGIYMFDERIINLPKMISLEIFLIGLLLSGAMSGFVGFVMILIVMIVYILYLKIFRKKHVFNWFLKIGIVLVMFIWSVSFLTYFAKSKYALDILDLNTQSTQIATEGLKDENGTGRIHIWKKGLENVPKYWMTGIGIDHYFYVDAPDIIYDPVTGNAIDKAHNEYIQILLTEGVFKCVAYIIFLLWIYFKGVVKIIKTKKVDPLLVGLFFAYQGYAVQAFFNISVLTVAPIFFIIAGLLLAQLEKYEIV